MGWLILSYDNDIPVCLWVTERECCVLNVCLDERLFGDTIFRAERVSNKYVISDVFMYNSSCIFGSSTFKQRYDWTARIFKKFYRPGLVEIIHKSELPKNTKLKGYEVYDFKEGSRGCFVDLENRETVLRTDIPDVYTVKGKEGYVLVPNLKTSVFLRSKGAEFQLRCNQKDGNWVVQEDLT
jgi:hypothetical protein